MRRTSLTSRRIFAAAACTLTIVVSAGAADQDSMGFGPDPELPAPQKKSLMPTVNIAPAAPWAEGAKPTAAPGFTVTAYATDLDHHPSGGPAIRRKKVGHE